MNHVLSPSEYATATKAARARFDQLKKDDALLTAAYFFAREMSLLRQRANREPVPGLTAKQVARFYSLPAL